MRYWMFGVAAAALSTATMAQDSAWGFFNGDGGAMGAGVQAADGSQLLIKCDQPGKHRVFAVVVARQNLAAPLPASQFDSEPVTLRTDEAAPWDDNWRFNDKLAMAVDQGNTRTLSRLLEKIQNAKTFAIQFKQPKDHSIFNTTFKVAGAKDAIAEVYAGCKDDNPLASASG